MKLIKVYFNKISIFKQYLECPPPLYIVNTFLFGAMANQTSSLFVA